MLDITLATCNYNTPDILTTMLKSWKEVNGDVTNKCLVIDNSTNDSSYKFLEKNKIWHVKNPGGTHPQGVQIALDMVKTRYMLLVDTDVILKKNLLELFTTYTSMNYTMVGEVCGDRGGFQLYRRVNPWFCLIDVDFINYYSIRFTDMNRIRESRSEGFFLNKPLAVNSGMKQHDVGATFLEDVMRWSGTVYNVRLEDEYFKHYEGMSWRKDSGIETLMQENMKNELEYEMEFKKHLNSKIGDFYQ